MNKKSKSNELIIERIIEIFSVITKNIHSKYWRSWEQLFPELIDIFIRSQIHSDLKLNWLLTILNFCCLSDSFIDLLYLQYPDICKQLVYLAELKDFEISKVSLKVARVMLPISKYGEIFVDNWLLKVLSQPSKLSELQTLSWIVIDSDMMRIALERDAKLLDYLSYWLSETRSTKIFIEIWEIFKLIIHSDTFALNNHPVIYKLLSWIISVIRQDSKLQIVGKIIFSVS